MRYGRLTVAECRAGASTPATPATTAPDAASDQDGREPLPDPVAAEDLVQLCEDRRRAGRGDHAGLSGSTPASSRASTPAPQAPMALACRKASWSSSTTRGSRPGVRRTPALLSRAGRASAPAPADPPRAPRRTRRTGWPRRSAARPCRWAACPRPGRPPAAPCPPPSPRRPPPRPPPGRRPGPRRSRSAGHRWARSRRPVTAPDSGRGRRGPRSGRAPGGRGPRPPGCTARRRCWPAPGAGAP